MKTISLALSTLLLTTPITLFFPSAVGQLIDISTNANSSVCCVVVIQLLIVAHNAVLLVDDVLQPGNIHVDQRQFDVNIGGEVCCQEMSRLSRKQSPATSPTFCVFLTCIVVPTMSSGMAIGSVDQVLPCGAIFAVAIGRFMKKKQSEVQDTLALSIAKAEEVFSNIRLVRQFVREDYETDKYKELVDLSRDQSISVGIANSLMGSSIHIASNISLAAVLGYGGHLVLSSHMTAGALTSFLLYSIFTGFNFGGLGTVYADFMRADGAAKRIFEVVGVVGSSGSGKSTLGVLLTRLYDPQVPCGCGGFRASSQSIQDAALLSGSESARYGKMAATDEEVVAVAKAAHVDDFVSRFPHGYETLVGDRGIQISGGQKQRIAIARALIKDPKILILDEATSSLDHESEFLIQQALQEASKGRTVLKIAHRLETVLSAVRQLSPLLSF
ncbi:hypothetical protein GUITHDRAFT_121098 [Guillardia theta CCMP2712]|uniref:Uncharacterized protein n=1 Tax=Guillardia theta (strain CCMP2712) TaxID=905079 RepID=L1IA22_GUITC|nr:hypothetical protein GUITHDRAFT_121098 [Guillardia theta CCMP2712]EKX32744.1 hypothetical protein GUITHDRAFT_121098 [Guillardia theta CCMP2712]|eukprot:XP_005819724.1 hypothetical protein GUITHDRAFT_121098 [Guillardia theta CCMP2712]